MLIMLRHTDGARLLKKKLHKLFFQAVIKRNAFLGIHAVTAAELALSGIKSKIPVDEVVDTLKITGELMSPLLKETSQGGLAKTKTAKELEKILFKNTKNREEY